MRSSLQGDVRFVDVLEHMGCTVESRGSTASPVSGGPLRGIDVDMNDISDTVMTLAAVACFADGPTTHPQRRPHPPQGDRPPGRPGHRAAPPGRRGRGIRRRPDDHAAAAARRRRSRPTTTTAWR